MPKAHTYINGTVSEPASRLGGAQMPAAAVCGYSSMNGSCKKMVDAGGEFCKRHTCPLDGCTRSKPRKDLDCGHHDHDAHTNNTNDAVTGEQACGVPRNA